MLNRGLNSNNPASADQRADNQVGHRPNQRQPPSSVVTKACPQGVISHDEASGDSKATADEDVAINGPNNNVSPGNPQRPTRAGFPTITA